MKGFGVGVGVRGISGTGPGVGVGVGVGPGSIYGGTYGVGGIVGPGVGPGVGVVSGGFTGGSSGFFLGIGTTINGNHLSSANRNSNRRTNQSSSFCFAIILPHKKYNLTLPSNSLTSKLSKEERILPNLIVRVHPLVRYCLMSVFP